MAEEKKSVFRKEALDRISSPEDYDQYLQVTGPGIWMTLGAVILLLIGACIWAVCGRLTTTMKVPVISADNSLVCYIPSKKLSSIDPSMMVKVADTSYDLVNVGRAQQLIDDTTDVSIRVAGELPVGSFVEVLDVDGELPDGIYVGEIQVESVAPISFILN